MLPRLAVIALLGLAAAPAAAQSSGTSSAVSFGVSGGLSLPTGEFGDVANSGFRVAGVLQTRPTAIPIGLRAEFGYSRYGAKALDALPGVEGDFRIISGTANAILALPLEATTVRPYLIGGVGVYNRGGLDVRAGGSSFDFGESQTKLGLNGGVGLDLPLSGIAGFLEVRFHSVFTDNANTSFVPITFGVRF